MPRNYAGVLGLNPQIDLAATTLRALHPALEARQREVVAHSFGEVSGIDELVVGEGLAENPNAQVISHGIP